MDNEASSVWAETTGVRAVATAARSTLPSAFSRAADHTDLIPSTDDEMLAELVPCLQLVAPVGMPMEDQDTWFEAAMKALAGIPIGLLQRGAAAAMLKADHPSKVVPAIMAEVGDAWDRRRRLARTAPAQQATALPAPGGESCTPDELDSICRQFKVGRYSQHRPPRDPARPVEVTTDADPNRPCRAPSREDHIRLFGIDPEASAASATEAA